MEEHKNKRNKEKKVRGVKGKRQKVGGGKAGKR